MLNMITCGESHGQSMAAIVEGMPSGLPVDLGFINGELARRQKGYGRGGRQKIEKDKVEVIGGVLKGKTTGAPVGFLLTNADFKIDSMPDLFRPRPGHADLAGALKYDQNIRPVLERASARETVMRVAAGALAKLLLREFGIEIAGHVVQIGKAACEESPALTVKKIREAAERSEVACVCAKTEKLMIAEIDRARQSKDSIGGVFEVRACGVPAGIGSHVHFERKLDARLAHRLMGLQSVKAVEIGDGIKLGTCPGSAAHDEIFYSKEKGYFRETNRAGGIEGGMSNGSDIVVRAVMKPIATLGQPLASVNMQTRRPEKADYERADICAVPAGSVIGESLVAYTLAEAFLEKFGGDSLREIRRNFDGYLKQIHE
ncbi:MAG: chorismate synthase [Candidatus Omnitrophota bacterium]